MKLVKSIEMLVIVGTLILVLAASLACASPGPTATPAPPATAAAPVAPTSVTQPMATAVLGTPTPTIALPTPSPTRALPTATPAETGQPVYGGTLTVTEAENADTFDPAWNNLAGSLEAMYNIYQGLLDSDPQGNITPGLATSWDISSDGMTITFHLRQGVKFQDGTDFNAQAVKWNYDRYMNSSEPNARTSEIAPYVTSVTVVDSQTVQFQLKAPFRPLLPTIATDRLGFLVSPAAVEKYGGGRQGDYSKHPTGTGPFELTQWTVNQQEVLEKNPNYWDTGKPYLDKIIIQEAIPTDVQQAMIRTGEADIIEYYAISGQQLPIFQRIPSINVQIQKGAGTYFFQFNTTIAPYDNKALRQAFAYAIDRPTMVKTVFGGLGDPAYTLLSGGWGQDTADKPMAFDLATAKQKMAEAGYPNGVSMKIGCDVADINKMGMCETAQAMVKQIGLNLQIVDQPAAGYISPQIGFLASPGFGVLTYAIRVDPNTLIQALMSGKGFQNVGAYSNPQVEELINQAAGVYDTAKAKAIYDQIQTIVAQDAYLVFVDWRYNFWTSLTTVHGYVPYLPPVKEYLGNVWIEK